MRKIINGKLYNTDTAEFVDEYTYSYPSDFNYEYEKLYRKRTGEFFLYGEGGPASKYSVCTGQNEWSGGEKLIPLSDDEAREWLEENSDADTYLQYFTAEE